MYNLILCGLIRHIFLEDTKHNVERRILSFQQMNAVTLGGLGGKVVQRIIS